MIHNSHKMNAEASAVDYYQFENSWNVPGRVLERIAEGLVDEFKALKNHFNFMVETVDKVLVQPPTELVEGALEAVWHLPATVKGITLDPAIKLVGGLGSIIPDTGKAIAQIMKNFKPSCLKEDDGVFKAIGGVLGSPVELVKGLWNHVAIESIGGAMMAGYEGVAENSGKDIVKAVGSVRTLVANVLGQTQNFIMEDAWKVLNPALIGLARQTVGIVGLGKPLNMEVDEEGKITKRAAIQPNGEERKEAKRKAKEEKRAAKAAKKAAKASA